MKKLLTISIFSLKFLILSFVKKVNKKICFLLLKIEIFCLKLLVARKANIFTSSKNKSNPLYHQIFNLIVKRV